MCSRKSFETLIYMTTRVSHVSTKFFVHPTDPFQLIARGVRGNRSFCDLFATSSIFFTVISFHTFQVLKSFLLWLGKTVSNLVQIQKGFRISKRILTERFKINVLLAISFSLLEIRTQFSECLRVTTWQHCLIDTL